MVRDRGYDAVDVLVIEQASFRTPWKREHFESELSGKHTFPFVAVCEGQVVGYVCLMSLFEEAQILDIAVSPEQRGRGIARALLEHACAVARKKHAEPGGAEDDHEGTRLEDAVALLDRQADEPLAQGQPFRLGKIPWSAMQ